VNRYPASRRRFRVVARPPARARRARLLGAAAAVLILGAVAVAAARHAASSLFRTGFPRLTASAAAPESAAVAGVAEPLLSLMQAAADAAGGSAGEKAAALKAAFPCVSDVSVRRPWGEKRSTLTPTLRRAVAPALRRGRPAGFLGDDGAVFFAPEQTYALSGPSVDVAGAGEDDLKSLAREWPALTAPGALPAPLSEMVFVAEGGERWWEARLTDGTAVEWGRLDWTKEKILRLTEALADARAKSPGAFSADLRYFDDGKVLLRPAGTALAAAGHGGVR
jgi:hypothetical protein